MDLFMGVKEEALSQLKPRNASVASEWVTQESHRSEVQLCNQGGKLTVVKHPATELAES